MADDLTTWQCEKHVGVKWPHDDCPGPGMPLAESLVKAPWFDEQGRLKGDDVSRPERPGEASADRVRRIAVDALYDARNDGKVMDEAAVAIVDVVEPEIRKDEREQLRKHITEERSVDAAEGSYKATLSAAEDPYDDTGWAEPMTDALIAGLDQAIQEIDERAEDGVAP